MRNRSPHSSSSMAPGPKRVRHRSPSTRLVSRGFTLCTRVVRPGQSWRTRAANRRLPGSCSGPVTRVAICWPVNSPCRTCRWRRRPVPFAGS